MAKHASEMNDAEYATLKKDTLGGKGARHAEHTRRPHMTDIEYVASIIRGWDAQEIAHFQAQYGIGIEPALHQVKKYKDMSPAEKEQFAKEHGVAVAPSGRT